jgi:glycosyltransferase involved in cell wall biosynthesis
VTPPHRPRVLHVGPDVRGGMGSSIRALFGSRLGRDYELEFVATHTGTGALRRLRVFATALTTIAVWSLRRRGRIVHVHSTVRGSMYRKAACVLLARALGRRVVLHVHSGPGDVATFREPLGRPSLAYLRLAYRLADSVLAVSGVSATALETAFGAIDITVVPNAVAVPEPRPRPGEHAGSPLVVYLGGFANPVKGGDVLVEALGDERLASLRFVLAGPGEPPWGDSGPPRGPGSVVWRGWLEEADKARLMREADVFVLASTSEGLPMALLEAMSYGLAIVATAVGGVPEVVDDGTSGVIVPPGDPASLASALVRIGDDPALLRQLAGSSLERSADFAPDSVATRIEAIYSALL